MNDFMENDINDIIGYEKEISDIIQSMSES